MKKKAVTAKKTKASPSRSRPGSAETGKISDWRAETLARVRALIKQAEPDVVEELKWKKPSNPSGVPVWSHNGILCTGETYKDKVKLTFANGASLEDPARLFNSSLEGNLRRAIDIHEGDEIDETALKALVRDAVKRNTSKRAKPHSGPSGGSTTSKATKRPAPKK